MKAWKEKSYNAFLPFGLSPVNSSNVSASAQMIHRQTIDRREAERSMNGSNVREEWSLGNFSFSFVSFPAFFSVTPIQLLVEAVEGGDRTGKILTENPIFPCHRLLTT